MRTKDPGHLIQHQWIQKSTGGEASSVEHAHISPYAARSPILQPVWIQYLCLSIKVLLLMHGCPWLLLYVQLYEIHFTSVESSFQLAQVEPMLISSHDIITYDKRLIVMVSSSNFQKRKECLQLSTDQIWNSHCMSGTVLGVMQRGGQMTRRLPQEYLVSQKSAFLFLD